MNGPARRCSALRYCSVRLHGCRQRVFDAGPRATLLRIAQKRITFAALLAIAGCFALVPQIFAAASGFPVLPEALLLSTLVLATLRQKAWTAGLLALLLCLFRPDGVVFAFPLFFWLLAVCPARRTIVRAVLLTFLLLGTAYFIWRWHYFGEFLPLPFTVKANASRMLGLFVSGSFHGSILPLFFLAAVCLLLVLCNPTRPDIRSMLALVLCLVIAPTVFYSSMRLDQNVAGRFFFYLPLTAAILIAMSWDRVGERRLLLVGTLSWLVCFLFPFLRELRTTRDLQFTKVHRIGESLSMLPQQASMLVTEAGFLPYDSGWRAIDAWGLNTPLFAHRLIQPDDVPRLSPDLIVVHPSISDSCLPDPNHAIAYPDRTWSHMTRNLVLGASAGNYELWLVPYGSPYYQNRRHWQAGAFDRECWYLNSSSPLYSRIAAVLRMQGATPPPESTRLETSRRAGSKP